VRWPVVKVVLPRCLPFFCFFTSLCVVCQVFQLALRKKGSWEKKKKSKMGFCDGSAMVFYAIDPPETPVPADLKTCRSRSRTAPMPTTTITVKNDPKVSSALRPDWMIPSAVVELATTSTLPNWASIIPPTEITIVRTTSAMASGVRLLTPRIVVFYLLPLFRCVIYLMKQ